MGQTAGTFQGHKMGIYIGGTLVAAANNVNLDMGVNMVDINNADTGDYDVVAPSRRNASASGSCHFQFDAGYGFEDLFNAWKAGTKLSLRFSTENPGDIDYSFDGYIESLKASFPDHANSTYDFTIRACTDVSKATNT